MNIAEFFVKLGVVSDKAELGQFQNSVNDVVQSLFNLKNIAIIGAMYAIDRFVESTVTGVTSLKNFNDQTDLSIDKLQRWQVAGKLSNLNMSFEEISSSIQAVQKNLTAIKLGGGDVSAYNMLGITDTVGRDTFSVLDEVREKIKGLDNATAVNLLQRIGLTPNFINVLRLSREEFDKLGKERFLSAEQRKNVTELGTAIAGLKIELSLIKDKIVAEISPALSQYVSFMEKIISKILEIKDNVFAFFKSFKFSDTFISAILSIISVFNPFVSLMLRSVAIFQDLMNYVNGTSSVIRTLTQDFTKLIDTVKSFMQSSNVFSGIGLGNVAGSSMQSTFNNVFHIAGGGVTSIAGAIVDRMQDQFNHGFDEKNNGVYA